MTGRRQEHAGTALAEAIAQHRVGNLPEAERLYRAILAEQPEHTEALHLLGVLAHQCGQHAAAVELIGKALARGAGVPEHHANFGLALHALGRVTEAEASYRKALALREAYPEAHNNLGSALQDQGRTEEAQAHYRRALELREEFPEALVNLGTVLRDADRPEDAAECFRRALALDPENPTAHSNLGVVYKETGRLDEADAHQREALRLAPGDPEALVNLGLLREAQGRRGEAEACYRQALASDPGFALARWNLALLLIGCGDLPEGRDLYEARFDSRRVLGVRVFAVPRWQGEDLTGKRILVWREQGIGDELLYGTCLPDLVAMAGHVVLELDERLVPLFARTFPQATVRAETLGADGRETVQPPDFDVHIPMASLPRFLRRRLSDFPPRRRYLRPDAQRAGLWRRRLADLGPGLRIGICWRSQRTHGERKHQYTQLDQWAPVLRLPGAVFVNLQYDVRADELRHAEERLGVRLHHWPDTDLKNDLEAAAALTANLDLVITVQSSVGEMAGALGVPVWRFGGVYDWTMQGTACRPWFPAMRMWGAGECETLGDVLARIAAELRRLAAVPPTADPLHDVLDEARALHAAGRWPDAEKAYQRVLQADPEHAEALHGYGRLGHQAGRPDIAVALIGQSIDVGGGTAERHRDRGLAFQALGAFEEAVAEYRAAVAHDPDDAEALGNLGAVLLNLGDAAGAAHTTSDALERRPDWAGLHANLALALQALGQGERAVRALHRALALDPALAEAWNSLGHAELSGRPAVAQASCARALRLNPDYAEAHGNLGLALLALDQPDDALACQRRAQRLRPDAAAVLANLALALEAAGQGDAAGLAWWRILLLDPAAAEGFAGLADLRMRQGRHEASVRAWRRALAVQPRRAEWHYNLGNALHALARPDAADAAFRRAVDLDPGLSLARFNRGYAALAQGRIVEGWTGLEARFAAGQAHPDRRFPRAAWDGSDLTGKRVLVWREQGLGDELMFSSCYADLIARAGHVIIECDPRLVGLFARSFPDVTVRAAGGEPDDFDVHVAAGSLPLHLRRSLADFPARPGWLVPDPERVPVQRARLAALGRGPVVGIAWRSGLVTPERAGLYTRLADWGPVFAVPGVRFVNLQYDDCAAEIAAAERRFGVTIHRWSDLDLRNDLEGAAALTASLDLVLSAGTSVAEMAGALGVPVWRFGARNEWTAMGAAVRPWYPSMRPFTPAPGEAMATVLARMGRELARLAG
ncbi:tetratricopeptide repeat protein [Azospirillum sp.]|uniref:tetratricopeptide repeat protein n=1 Tax=Azospirillum sp. TaxID=34012 RepID=UPI002D2E846B|nr:tetratricopeptide repeat protein [Azospirillum sp.]HYD67985.1 tetratricopeptide repeat protein [Azospirillum sp.]